MQIVLLVIPVFVILSSVFLYHQSGKKEILKLDIVQFLFAFVLSPLVFVWLKSLAYYIMRNELGFRLDSGDIFIIDTILSLLWMYIFAFVVIHSLTKSFAMKRYTDPLYDMFHDSEFFHHDFSHAVIYGGSMLVFSFLGTVNVLFPIPLEHSQLLMALLSMFGFGMGVAIFYGMWNYDSAKPHFYKFMKLGYGLVFAYLLVLSLAFSVPMDVAHGVYWTIFSTFMSLFIISLFFEYPEESTSFLSKFRYKHTWLRKLKETFLDPFRTPPRKMMSYTEITKAITEQQRAMQKKMMHLARQEKKTDERK